MPLDRPTIRMFTLADQAMVHAGKAFISGASLSAAPVQSLPGVLSPLWLVMDIRLPAWTAGTVIPVRLRIAHEDGSPFLGWDTTVPIRVIQSDTYRTGEVTFGGALPLSALAVEREELLAIELTVGAEVFPPLPLRVVLVPPPSGGQQ